MKRYPNILMIQVDQQSASSLAAYGNTVSHTPAIDKLAAESVVFENAYCNFPLCAPSRCSMMTGRLATRVEVYDTAAEFRASLPTMAHYLRSLGYQTTLCGKMHFIGPDQLHGFEERLTTEIYPADFGMLPRWESEEPADYTTNALDALRRAKASPRTIQMDYDEEVVFRAKRRLYDYGRSDDERPFFLLVSFTHPHEPFVCPTQLWDLYSDDDIDMPRVGRLSSDRVDPYTARLYGHYGIGQEHIPDELVRKGRRGYYACMSYVDDLIGDLMSVFESSPFKDDTVVVFTSDHGEMLGERGLWFKKCFFEDAVRIPLMFRVPGVVPHRVKGNVSLVDLLPTLVAFADGDRKTEFADPMDGESLVPLIRRESQGWSDTVCAELTCEGVVEPVVMVKRASYKYIVSESNKPILYELNSDPLETTNLAGVASHGRIEAELRDMVDGTWGSLSALRKRVTASQKSRALVRDALRRGKYHSWDYRGDTDGGRYLRFGKSYNQWAYWGVDVDIE